MQTSETSGSLTTLTKSGNPQNKYQSDSVENSSTAHLRVVNSRGIQQRRFPGHVLKTLISGVKDYKFKNPSSGSILQLVSTPPPPPNPLPWLLSLWRMVVSVSSPWLDEKNEVPCLWCVCKLRIFCFCYCYFLTLYI